jgi:hypothetical protein
MLSMGLNRAPKISAYAGFDPSGLLPKEFWCGGFWFSEYDLSKWNMRTLNKIYFASLAGWATHMYITLNPVR